jgi:hypothetical protein
VRFLSSCIVSVSAWLCLVGSVSAKEVTFAFDVHFSGAEIYPCDAGVVQKDSGQYCHFKGTSTACSAADVGRTPAATGAAEAIDYNTGLPVLNPADAAYACICTGAAGTDPNHMGWGPATNGVIQGNASGVTVARSLRGSSAEAANSVPQELQTQLESVVFNFGSELYGAQFFVDLCYRGSQLPYYLSDNNPMNVPASFATKAYVTATNPFLTGTGTTATRDYVSLSDLALSWDMACDQQGLGTYRWDHNGTTAASGAFDTFITDLTDTGTRTLPSGYTTANGVNMTPAAGTDWVGNLNGASGEFRRSGTLTSSNFAAAQQQWIIGDASSSDWINTFNSNVPRFCKLRYYFAEKPFRDRERAWQRADARFVVKWSVEEPTP